MQEKGVVVVAGKRYHDRYSLEPSPIKYAWPHGRALDARLGFSQQENELRLVRWTKSRSHLEGPRRAGAP
jgi:hypothetical protein